MLIVLPTALLGASFDWCLSDDVRSWPTISSAMACQPGGYFIAIAAVPAYTATALVFWMIDSIAVKTQTEWQKFQSATGHSSHQRNLGKQLGCYFGYAGA